MQKEHDAQYAADVKSLIVSAANTERVYWRNAPENKTFPYIVFEVRSVGGDKTITLDLWHTRGNDVELSDLTDTVEAALDNEVIYNAYHASIIKTQNNKQWIADEDERLIHLNMSFDATYQA